MKALLAAWVLALCMPEAWNWLTPWDVWAADQIASGLLIATLGSLVFRAAPLAAGVAVFFGLTRTGCVAMWPEASDTSGSICDAQTGIPLTVGALVVALVALERYSRGGTN